MRDKTIKLLLDKKIITDTDKLISKEALVTKEIKENSYGQVKVDKKNWAAYSTETLKVGVKAKIDSIEGVRLKVSKK